MTEHVVDASGLFCPMPLLQLKKKLKEAAQGDIIRVLSTDPHSEIDFRAYLERYGYPLQVINQDDQKWELIITLEI